MHRKCRNAVYETKSSTVVCWLFSLYHRYCNKINIKLTSKILHAHCRKLIIHKAFGKFVVLRLTHTDIIIIIIMVIFKCYLFPESS